MALMDLIKQIISGLAFGLVIFGILFMVFGYFGILTQITQGHYPTSMDTFNAGFGFIGIALGLKAL